MKKSMSEPAAIGERLRWAREQAGLSQAQTAKALGVHRPTVSQIEAGQRVVRPDEIVQLAGLYGIREVWILKGEISIAGGGDPKLELVARELKKLDSDDLGKILKLLSVLAPREPVKRD